MVASNLSFESSRPVYAFLDSSNIFIGAKNVALNQGDTLFDTYALRLHLQNLRQFIQRGRVWAGGYAAAGMKNFSAGLLSQFMEIGFEYEVCERGEHSGKEQGVDEKIQYRMFLRSMFGTQPGTIVLLTGDGAGYSNGIGFIPVLEHLKRYGHSIEVMSWGHSLNQNLGDWARQNGKLILLDPYLQSLTYVNRGRPGKSLSRFSLS